MTNEEFLDAVREVVRERDGLVMEEVHVPMRLSIVIDKLRDELAQRHRTTTVYLSCVQWVEMRNSPGDLMLGGSDDLELFANIDATDEDQLVELCRESIKAHFRNPAWVSVRLVHKRGPRLDLHGIVVEDFDGGLVRVGPWSEQLDAMYDMITPCGKKLKDTRISYEEVEN
jgi:hypothetical protein